LQVPSFVEFSLACFMIPPWIALSGATYCFAYFVMGLIGFGCSKTFHPRHHHAKYNRCIMPYKDLLRNRRLSEWSIPMVGAILLLGAATANAAAVPVTFAQAIESSASTNSNVFAYNNNGTGSDAEFGTSAGGALGAAVPISFVFLPAAGTLPDDLTGIQDATISMTSSTTSQTTTAFGGTFAEQAITGDGTVTDTIKITRSSAAAEGAGAKTNLLTVTFTGDLSGPIGGPTPDLSADTGLGNTVTYSSDFVSFAPSTQQDFNLALSSWDPLVTPPTGLAVNSDGYFNSATAAGAATFDFQEAGAPIPEPTSLGVLGLGGLLLLSGRRLLRRSGGSIAASV
jgi:hypothetical protein